MPHDRPQELSKFGFTMMVVLGLIAFFLVYRQRTHLATIFGSISALFLACSLLAPKILGPVEMVWMGLSRLLGAINTRVIMGLLYVFVFVPLGLCFRLVKRDQMRRLWKSGETTNWEDYSARQRNPRHFDNMY